MATLNSAPTPSQFATAWTRGFAAAVRDAAGKDGRLSVNEAKKIAQRTDGLAVYGDNAVNYLERTGQQTVSVEKLIGKGHDYAFALAERVAGNNNRVSLVEATHLPRDLQADFLALRGRAPVAAPTSLDGAALLSALDAATKLPDGSVVNFMSESDYPVVPFAIENPTGQVDATTVMRRLAPALTADIFQRVTNFRTEVVAEAWTKAESHRWLSELSEPYIGMDDEQRPTMRAFANIATVLEDNLKDVRIVKLGEPDRNGNLSHDSGLYAYAAVGQTADGKLAGVYFGSVET